MREETHMRFDMQGMGECVSASCTLSLEYIKWHSQLNTYHGTYNSV